MMDLSEGVKSCSSSEIGTATECNLLCAEWSFLTPKLRALDEEMNPDVQDAKQEQKRKIIFLKSFIWRFWLSEEEIRWVEQMK